MAAALALVAPVVLLGGAGQPAPGELDTTFGSRGIAVSPVDISPAEVVVDDGGDLVVAGFGRSGDGGDFALARFRADGALDRSFGTDGRVSTDMAGGSDSLMSLVRQPDGKLVAAGSATVPDPSQPVGRPRLALARYRPDGRLDRTFGEGGRVLTDVGGFVAGASAVAVQPDGKLVIAGRQALDFYHGSIVVARYRHDGSLDPTFGTGGIVLTTLPDGRPMWITSMTLGRGGRITVAGTPEPGETTLLARYDGRGRLDRSFGADGVATSGVPGFVNDLVELRDGGLVTAGYGATETGTSGFQLIRHRPDGTLDRRFGDDGVVVDDFGTDRAGAEALTVDPEGRMLVTGYGQTGSDTDFTLARYHRDGSPDPRFGDGGRVTTDIAGAADFATAITPQSPGRVVVAGYSEPGPPGEQFALTLVRYVT